MHLAANQQITAIVLFGSEISFVSLLTTKARFRSDVGIVAGVFSSVAALCILIAIFAEHFHSVRPSLLLSFYLAVTLLLDITKTYSFFHRSLISEGIFLSLVLATKTILIVLEEVPKRRLFLSKELQANAGKEAVSGFWTRTLYLWLNATFLRGYKAILKIKDLDRLDSKLESQALFERFLQSWDEGNTTPISHKFTYANSTAVDKSKRRSLLWSLLKTIGPIEIAISMAACLLTVACSFAQPFLIKQIVSAVENPDLSLASTICLILAAALIYSSFAVSSLFSTRIDP